MAKLLIRLFAIAEDPKQKTHRATPVPAADWPAEATLEPTVRESLLELYVLLRIPGQRKATRGVRCMRAAGRGVGRGGYVSQGPPREGFAVPASPGKTLAAAGAPALRLPEKICFLKQKTAYEI